MGDTGSEDNSSLKSGRKNISKKESRKQVSRTKKRKSDQDSVLSKSGRPKRPAREALALLKKNKKKSKGRGNKFDVEILVGNSRREVNDSTKQLEMPVSANDVNFICMFLF